MSNAATGDTRPEKTAQAGPTGAGAAAAQSNGMDRIKDMMKGNTLLPLLIAGAAAIALMVALFMWASSPTYGTLFSNLSEADGGSIINELEARGVPYQFGNNGQAILVPSDQVHVLRLQLAEQGLPQGGNVGFELMDTQAFGISQFAEQVNYQRSLEGELTRSIESMNPVSTARIHLSMAKPSVFIRDREPAKASVVLTLHNGRTLGESQVEAIRHLVSSSVPDLTPDNVTVVDHAGNLLSRTGGNSLDGEELSYIQEVERRYQASIRDILTPLFGKQNVRVQVAAQIDFSVREETVERYGPNQEPNEAAIRSTQMSGTLNGSEALARGIPGALSNTPPGWLPSPIQQNQEAAETETAEAAETTATPATAAEQSNLRYDNVVNYEVDRNITHVQHQQGQVERLSVAAVVNYRSSVDEEGNPVQIPLTDEEMAQVTRLIRQAMGFSQARGDALEVVNSPFTEVNEESVQREWWTRPEAQKLILGLSRYLMAALFALAFYLLIVRPLLRRHLTQPLAVAAMAEGPESNQAGSANTFTAADTGSEGVPRSMTRKRERKASNYEEDLREVRQLAKDDPRLISMVVRSWINKNG